MSERKLTPEQVARLADSAGVETLTIADLMMLREAVASVAIDSSDHTGVHTCDGRCAIDGSGS